MREAKEPLIVYEKRKSALVICALDAAGVSLGLYPGQPLADARAMHKALIAVKADAQTDATEFLRIAEWLMRYSPHVGAAGTGDAMLDISGCAHLFGGEEALAADALARVHRAGIEARAAIADAPGAAWAIAHYGGFLSSPASGRGVGGEGITGAERNDTFPHPARLAPRHPLPQAGDGRLCGRIIPAGAAREALADLPVAALRLSSEAAEGLHRLGLKRIGQLYDLPRAPLAARFGAQLLNRLAQALGEEREPISPIRTAPEFSAELRLAEPVASADEIMTCLEALAPKLEALLEREGQGGRRFELALFRVDNHVARVSVGAARPAREPSHMLRLFKDRLADIHDERDAGFGYDHLRLSAFDCAAYELGVAAAFDAPPTESDASVLVDRLANRLGAGNVCAIRLANSHIPERSAEFVPTQEKSNAGAGRPPRPIKLLARPEPIEAMAVAPDGPPIRFSWRRVAYAVRRASGPERIAGEWRREETPAPTRDYYRVEDEAGRRYWVFREGFYGEEKPKWFLHGFFA